MAPGSNCQQSCAPSDAASATIRTAARDDAAPQSFHAAIACSFSGVAKITSGGRRPKHAVEPMGKASGQLVEKTQAFATL